MSRRARLSKPARTDLVEIWVYVAEESLREADRLIEAIHSRCEMLTRSPRAGRLRPELGPGVRSFPVGRYLIFYQEIAGGIAVARVISGHRELRRAFPSS